MKISKIKNYLLLGEDILARDRKINEIKEKLLSSSESLKFDYEVLYAQRLDSETLKKTLLSLPAVSKQRLIVIRECHKLSSHNKQLIIDFVSAPYSPTILILDSDTFTQDNSFSKKLSQFVKIVSFFKDQEVNVFDLTRKILIHKEVEALKVLSDLLTTGDHPLQILGGVVWFWAKSRERMPLEKYQKGLLALQEADLNIKRSRLKPKHALELLIVKLCC